MRVVQQFEAVWTSSAHERAPFGQIPALSSARSVRVEQLRLHRLAEPSADDAALEEGRPSGGRERRRSVGSPSQVRYHPSGYHEARRSMPALVMTRARSFMSPVGDHEARRPPHLSQRSTSILKLRFSNSRHGRYPQRCVSGLSFLAVHVAQSASSLSSTGGGGGATRDLHLLAAARTPPYLTVLKRGGCTDVASRTRKDRGSRSIAKVP